MKKNLFYTVMMMAVMAVVTISFTACGGGDDDPLNDNGQNKQDPDDISAYIWPSTQWDCSMDDIKKYMASSSMVVTEERSDILIYQTTDRKYMIGYAADENNKYCSCLGCLYRLFSEEDEQYQREGYERLQYDTNE